MRILPGLLLTAVFSSTAMAQEREYAPLLLELPANTRALGMGNAFVIGSSDPMAIFYNPAMSTVSGVSLDIQRYGGQGNTVSAAAGAEWWGGRVGIGVQAAAYSVRPEVLLGGVSESDLLTGGTEDVAEYLAAVSYGRTIKGIRLALTGRLVEQRSAGDHVTSPTFDLSTGIDIADFKLGLALQNVGPAYDFVGLDLEPPLRVTLGGAFDGSLPVGPLDLLAAAAVSVDAEGTIVPGAGLELGYWPISGRTFFARAGIRDPADPDTAPWTVGAGFSGDRITLDWALVDYEEGTSHRLTLRFR